ncbi:endonuclease I family protein [Flavobacterium procerum]|uniref:Endonuclease I family protein n=1 Tax=Flavobacterium procerum TaxID=1455569 RepID=A0ABV6BVP4_9FLAO
METIIITLLLAGILAGLIQFFVDFKGLPIFQTASNSTNFDVEEKLSFLEKLYRFVKDHWQFFGYLTIGTAGAFLTPLINEATNNRLGIDVFKNYAECILKQVEGKPVCLMPNGWYYLILFGYGIVFGYSSVRIIRSIGSLVLGNISFKQDEQQKKLEEAQKQINDLKEKLNTLTVQIPKPAAFEFAPQSENPNQLTIDYFNEAQNELDKRSYYSTIDTKNIDSLFTELNQLLENTHKAKLKYQPSLHLYPIVDRYQDGQLKSIYSGKSFSLETILSMDAQVDKARAEVIANFSALELPTDEFESNLEDSLPYNCEHVVPQSWFNKEEPMRGDIHHLFTCEMKCNSFRSNNPYFEFPDYGSNYAELIRDECGKLEQNRFEPEINKGVVARAVLYFLVRYPGKINEGMGYTLSDVPMLLKWHNDNNVTIYECHRNQIIYKSQGNRNPFIDFPELADKINFKSAF